MNWWWDNKQVLYFAIATKTILAETLTAERHKLTLSTTLILVRWWRITTSSTSITSPYILTYIKINWFKTLTTIIITTVTYIFSNWMVIRLFNYLYNVINGTKQYKIYVHYYIIVFFVMFVFIYDTWQQKKYNYSFEKRKKIELSKILMVNETRKSIDEK